MFGIREGEESAVRKAIAELGNHPSIPLAIAHPQRQLKGDYFLVGLVGYMAG